MPATILIADDHDDNRELLQILLVNAGYEVREAKDGSECLAIARDERPDLIVIDLSMPVLDGWGVFRELSADESTERYRAWLLQHTPRWIKVKPSRLV